MSTRRKISTSLLKGWDLNTSGLHFQLDHQVWQYPTGAGRCQRVLWAGDEAGNGHPGRALLPLCPAAPCLYKVPVVHLAQTWMIDHPKNCPAGTTPTFALPTTSLLKSVCHRLSCTSLDGCDLLTSGGEGFSTVLIANCQSQSHPEV